MAAPTFDQFAQKAASLYPQATEDQLREAFTARFGGTPVRSAGPAREVFAARARELYPEIGDDQIDEAYEAKYGAGFLTESKRTLASQAYAPLVQGLGAIVGGGALNFLPGSGFVDFDDPAYAMFQHGARVREANAPSADVATRGAWDPYKLGQNVIGGLGQIAPAVLTGGASIAPLVAADAGSLATELEDEGMGGGEARARATAYATLSSALERIGLGRLIPKRLPGRIASGAQEAGTEIAQGIARSGAAGDPLLSDLERTIAEEGLPAGLAAALLTPGKGKPRAARQEEFAADTGLDVPRGTIQQDTPSPEPLADLKAQAAELGKTRRGVLVPAGQDGALPGPSIPLPNGARMVFASEQDAQQFQQELAAGNPQAVIGSWTGAGTGKPTGDALVVQAMNAQGQVVRESAVPKGEAKATAARFQQDFPLVKVVTPAQALARRQELLKGEASAFSELPPEELLRRTDPKAYLKTVDAAPMPNLGSMPRDPSAYFTPSKTSTQVDPSLLESRPSSGATALKRMAAAAGGKLDKRPPVTVKVSKDGRMKVADGNSTVAAARALGVPVEADLELELADEKFRKYERALTGEARASIAAQARDAEAYQGELNQRIDQVAQSIGATLKPGTTKASSGFGRIAEKIILEEGGNSDLKDMARATILVENKAQAQAALDAVLEQLGQAPNTSLRDTLLTADSFAEVLARDPYGYADIKLNVPGPNGRIYEVQIASREMAEAKEKVGHKLYEDGRSREGKIVESLRKIYGPKLNTEQMKKALNAATRMFRERDPQMQSLYRKSRKAYQAALTRWFTSSSNSSAVSGVPSALMPDGVTNDQSPSSSSLAAPPASVTTAGISPTRQNVEPPGQPAEGLSSIGITSEQSVARQSHRVITPGGQELEVRGRLVELDRLRASDDPDYPAVLQPRERGKRAALTTQVQKIARELKPFVLGPSVTTADGGPIVSPEGVVESGNGRVMALRLARDAHPENWQAYQAWVRTLGLDAAGLADPVYVQERLTPLTDEQLTTYTADANESTAARMSPTEQAIADGRRLDEELMTLVRSGDMSQSQNTDFLRGFIAKLPEAARNALVSADGRITPAGVQRAEAALVAKAYGGTPEVSTLLDRLYEDTTDETVKRITNALKLASAKFVNLKLAVETGQIAGDYDIGGEVVRAYDAVQRGRRSGMTPEQIANQGDLLDTGLRAAILKTFYRKLEPGTKNEWPQEKIAGQLQYYANQAVAQPGAQGSMFAAVPPLDLLEAAHRLAGTERAASDTEQFARRGTEPRGEGKMQVSSLRQLLAPITSSWNPEAAPRIRIVQSGWELPAHILESLGTDINGASDLERGTVYLVADNIAGRWEAERVLLHEAVGHYGFDRLYGDRFPGMVDQVMGLVGKDAEISKVETSIRERYGDLERPVMAAEIVAHLAERNIKHPLVKRIIAQFRELLRQLGFRVNLSKADLVYLIQRAAESMRERGKLDSIAPAAPREAFASRPPARALMVKFRGKTYPVASVEEAAAKWEEARDRATAEGGGGVRETGNGIPVLDSTGKTVARISYNGRIWTPEGKEWQGQMELQGGEQAPQERPQLALEPPEGQANPPTQSRLFASRGDQFQGPTGFGATAPEAPLPGPGAPIEVGGGEYQLGQFRGLSDNEQRVLTSVMGDLDQAVEGQRRGTRDWDTTEKAALAMLQRKFGLTLDSLVNRKLGSTANAEQLEAYGMLMAQTTREVKQIADQVANSRNPSSDQLAGLHAARERLGMLIAPAMGYATEAGRSLNILRKVSGDMKDADKILEALGDGSEASIRKFAKAVQHAGSVDQVIGVTRASYTPNLWDKFYEVWINGLLSGPTTHAVNMTSNGIFSMLEMGTEAVASVFSKSVPMASVAARVAAVPHGVTLGLKNGRIAWQEERAVLTPEDKLETHQKAIEGTLGRVARIPGRALGAEDEFFKGINYTGQLAALAMDEAVRLAPDDPRPAFDRIMGNIQARPDLIQKAKEHAARLTFTSPLGDVGRVAMSFANSKILGMRPLRLIIPFIRTPTNILKRAIEYTPAAPLFEQVRKDLSGGGRDAAMAWSRMAVGSTVAMSIMGLAAQGILSGAGPEDEDERALLMRQGWRPYSIKLGDKWWKFNRFEPVGMIVGIAADLYELSGPLKQGEYETLAAMLMTSIATNLGDKTFLRGITDAAQAYTDPQRYMARWAQGLVSSAVPNVVGQTTRWMDPFQREARTTLDAIRSKIPGQSERLAKRLDIAGEPIERDTGAPGNPFQGGKPKQDVLADTMLQLGVAKNAPSRSMVVSGKSFELKDHDYESYKAFVQKARWSALTPFVSSPQFRQLASINPQGAAMLLDKQYDDIGRQARMMWLFQNSRVLVPKQPGSSSLATSYR